MASPLSLIARASTLLLTLAGCTNGGISSASGGIAPIANVTRIDVSIAAFPLQQTQAGAALGYSPIVTNVAVGGSVQFVNVDNAPHTATSLGAVTSFPAVSPFSFSATSPSTVTAISGSWSSGTLQPGASSQIFTIDRAGVYLYGCFYHYSGNMRGEIVAQ